MRDRVREAEDPTTAPERIAALAADPSALVRAAAAAHRTVDDATLLRLAADTSSLVRVTAAAGAAGRPGVEGGLAASADTGVREVLAHTYADDARCALLRTTQEVLARDDVAEVRARVAETTGYRDLYDRLLADTDPRVRGRCAANPRATRDDVERLLTDPRAVTRRIALAVAADISDHALLRAAHDRSADVRWCALTRAGAPRAIAEALADDPDETVRGHARAALVGSPVWEPAGERAEVERRARAPRLSFDA